jgi:hypothetical protein
MSDTKESDSSETATPAALPAQTSVATNALTDQTNYLPRRTIISVNPLCVLWPIVLKTHSLQVFLACASVGAISYLDDTMISVALPFISADLSAGNQISWVPTAFFVYMLSFS